MNAEEKILSMLEFLMAGQEEIKASVTRLESEVGVLKTSVGRLESDVGVLKSDVGVLKSDVGVLKSDVGVLKSDVGTLKYDVSNLQQGQVRIENDHGKKLDALFDGYSQLYEISQEMRDDIKGIKEVQERHELYIKWHESRLNAEQLTP